MEPELSFRRELDLVPKPEEAGTLKISVKVLGSGILIGPTPDFVLSYKDFRLSNDHDLPRLNDWLCSAGLARQYVSFAACKLTELIFDSISLDPSQTSAMLVYMTCKIIPPPPPPRIEEVIQASVDGNINNIRFRPASMLAVDSLSRTVYKTNEKKMCRICLEDLKKGEIVVTLPCGHEFDDSCIVEWFGTGHVCPLCRFELPCEEVN